MGSVVYRIAGDPDQRVAVAWQNPFFGWNTYRAGVAQEEFEVEIHGGGGTHAIGVFVLRMWPCPSVCLLKLISKRLKEMQAVV